MKASTPTQQQNLQFSELVQVQEGQPVTTSLMVAEYFGKHHKDVLRAINLLDCSELFRERNFAPTSYETQMPNGGTRKDTMYYITRDGFTFLVMGFTGKVAAKFKEDYINAFNTMEETLRKNETNTVVELKRQFTYISDQLISYMSKFEKNMQDEQSQQNPVNELFNNAHNPNHYPKEYFLAILDCFSSFLKEEFDKGQWRGGTSGKLISRIEAARTLYLE